MKKSTPLFLLLFLAFSIAKTFAQDQKGNTWFFGNELGIRFTKPNNEPIVINNQGSPLNSGGSAVVSDPITGKVLFYTDGVTVYDASGQVMVNGSGLAAADNINQPVAISPVPVEVPPGVSGEYEPGQYYVFSNSSNGPVTVSLVDMNLPGNAGPGEPNLGEVVSNITSGASSSTSAMTVIGGETNYFLITQSFNTLHSYDIISPSLLPWPAPAQAISDPQLIAKSFVVNDGNNTVAIIPENPQANIKIYTYDLDFGLFTVEDTIFNSGRAGETIYDGAWSPDGENLYFSRNSASQGQIYVHYDDDIAPQPVLTTPVYQSYDLQMGPDGKMYHLYQEVQNGPYLIGRIENPDEPENLIYTPRVFEEDFGGKNFPQLVRQDFKFTSVEFDVQDTCANNMTKFTPNVAPAFDSLVWAFGDTTFQSTSPMLSFEDGTFPVSMTAWLNGIDSTITRDLEIIQNPLEISLPASDTTVCASAFPDFELTATAEGGNVEFYWSNNPLEDNAVGNFDSTGTYYVVAKSPDSGCTAYASVQIRICQEEKRVGNIWFFGDRAGIDFNPEEPTPIPDSSVMNAPEGTATISDRNGEILFYTDGSTVWNQQNDQMENGDNIGGDPLSTQSALIVPFPGDPTLYYIFTTDGSGVSYSVVDIKEAATLGAVVLKDVPLFSTTVEKVTAVEAGGVTWLLIHESGNFFRAYPITPTGIGTQVISEVGSAHNSGEGYMKFSTDGSRVAAAVAGPPPFVELLDFDDSTGVLSNPIKIELEDQPYGIEFSPDNEKLYISTSSEIFQYHINDTLTTEEVIASQKSLDIDGGANLGALQLGPNGQIYVAQENSDELLVINGPNTLQTDTSQVAISRFSLLSPEEPASLVSSGKGLPNFVQSIMEPESLGGFEFANQCLGEETQFVATGRCDTDEFAWIIRNPNGSQKETFSASKTPELYYSFDTPGVYVVELTISNPCALPADTTISRDVEIFAPPADPGFPESIGICLGDTTTLTAGPADGPFIYDWVLTPDRAGDRANNEIQVWEVGTYRVFITDTLTGCSESYDAIVQDAGPDFDLEEDLYYCVGDDGKMFDLGNPGSEYLIEVINMANNALIRTETSQRFTIATDQAGDFKYRVTVTDTDFDCASIDSLLVTVNELPQGNASGSVLTACGDTNGTLTLDITSAGDYSFEVFDFNDVSLEYVANVSGSTNGILAATGLGAGGYYIILTNNTSNCNFRINTGIEQDPAQIDIVDIPPTQANCSDQASVSVTVNGGLMPFSYFLNGETLEGAAENRQASGNPNTFNITNLLPGNYGLEVTDNNGCVATTQINITPADEEPLVLEGQYEGCVEDPTNVQMNERIFLRVDEAGNSESYTYFWKSISNPGNGIAGADPTSATAGFTESGTYKLTRTLASDPTCVTDTTFIITYNKGPELTFTFGDDCLGERTVTVNATGSGNYSYLWSDNAGAARTQTVTVNVPGTRNYSVRVRDRDTGCISDEFVEVTVNPEVRISLSASPVCDNEGMFTLMAETSPPNVRIDWYRTGETVPFNGGNNLNSVQVENAGSYYAIASTSGCTDTDDISVERWPVGQSTLPETKVVICPSSADPRRSDVRLNPDSTNAFSRYQWELDDEFLTSEKIIRPLVGGTYRITMTNPGGCIIEDEVEVVVSCKPILFVPNAIRPSSAIGDNKAFRIFTQDAIAEEGFQVYIYNRWGELIYQSKDPNFQWDGTFNGNPVPLEKYTYTIYYKGEGDPSDEVYQLQGGVTVLR